MVNTDAEIAEKRLELLHLRALILSLPGKRNRIAREALQSEFNRKAAIVRRLAAREVDRNYAD